MVALGLVTAMVVAVVVERNIWAPAWLVLEPSKLLHQSYQQFDTIVYLASDGRRGDVYEGIETVKFAEVVKSAEAVKSTEVVKPAEVVEFLGAGELPDAIELVEVDGLAGFVMLGRKEVLVLEVELEVGQMGIRGPLREVMEIVLEGTDWAVGPPMIEELKNNAGKVEDVALAGTSGHSDAVEKAD